MMLVMTDPKKPNLLKPLIFCFAFWAIVGFPLWLIGIIINEKGEPNGLLFLWWLLLPIFAYFLIIFYNRLVQELNLVKNAWSQVDVNLQRRSDLVENLIRVVNQYTIHEHETLITVTQARSGATGILNVKERSTAEQKLSTALLSFMAVVEGYPELKANQVFIKLQDELTNTENMIALARELYNNQVVRYNNQIQVFPKSILALTANFALASFFHATEEARHKTPKVRKILSWEQNSSD